MKMSHHTVGLIAAACLGWAGTASAADDAAAKAGAPAMRPMQHDPVAAAQKRLDRLGKKLNLNASQQAAWQTYSGALLKLAQQRAQNRENMRAARHSAGEDLPTPARLEKMAERMRQGADAVAKLAGDTKVFYEQLTPDQRTIFDLSARNAWRGRMLQRLHPGAGSGPMH